MPRHPRPTQRNRRYGTHQFLLQYLCDNFDIKKVWEFGMGNYSTKEFFEWGVESLTSIESHKKWAESCKQNGKDHDVHLIELVTPENDREEDQKAIDHLTDDDYDLVFVDGRPVGQRPECVVAAFGRTRFIVEHDSEDWPYGRFNNTSLPWSYLESREDPTGQYKCVQFEYMNPHTAVWTNDEEAYDQLLDYKEQVESPDWGDEQIVTSSDPTTKLENPKRKPAKPIETIHRPAPERDKKKGRLR